MERSPGGRPVLTAPDLSARDALVKGHLKLVRQIAGQLSRRLPHFADRDDLVAAGNVGLVDAAGRFDPARGKRFAAFASSRIRGAMLDNLRMRDALSRDMRRIAKAIEAAERTVERLTGMASTDEGVAGQLGVSADEMARLRRKTSDQSVSLDAEPLRSKLRPVYAGPSPIDIVIARESQEHLEAAVKRLAPSQLRVVSLYYGDGLQLKEIGAVLGFTESRACQILTMAYQNLRKMVSR